MTLKPSFESVVEDKEREIGIITISSTSTAEKEYFAQFKGKDFWVWNKKDHKKEWKRTGGKCCFNHIIGLPRKHGKPMPMWDYEKIVYDSIADFRYVWIKKSAGLGISEFCLRFMTWLCLYSDEFKDTQMIIICGPRLDLAVSLVDRIKKLFPDNISKKLFNTKETVVELNNVKIEAFPSHHVDDARGLPSVSAILIDEADFFPIGQKQNCRDVAERYIAKSDPYILMVSTPNAPEGLFESIEKEPEDTCLYHRLKFNYEVGLNKIYTPEEILQKRSSPSFEREYNLAYIGMQGNVFSPESIEKAIQKGTQLEQRRRRSGSYIPQQTMKSMGIDPSWSSSKFGVVVTQLKQPEGIAEVLYSEEFDKPDFNHIIDVIKKIRSTFNVQKVFIDDANPEVVRALKAAYSERMDYKNEMEHLRSKKLDIYQWMNIIPVNFRSEHREMLGHLKLLLDSETLAISPTTHSKLIVALRTAYAVDGDLNKQVTSHDDLLDALQLSSKLWAVQH